MKRRSGMVLIVTMVVSFALAATVIVLCKSMRVESLAAANMTASLQASSIERGAEQYVLAMVEQEGDQVTELSEDQFSAVPVGDGFFWILHPDFNDPQLPVFGLVAEADKLNINTASYDQMLRLPGMTDDIAAAVIDWRDEDSTPRDGGAESEYYLALSEPYYAKNAPFESVEEMLMLRGDVRTLLYGDGTAPPLGSQSSMIQSGSLGSDPELARGIYDMLTIYTTEPNTSADGQARVNITDRGQRTQLRDRLIARKFTKTRADEIVATLGRDRPRDIFDFYFRVKLKPEELDLIADDLTTTGDRTLRGRININTAPPQVLLTLNGLEAVDVDKLIAQRSSAGGSTGALGWVADALGQKAVGIGSQITTRSYQYSADILAVSGNGRSFKRCRIVVDTRSGTPQIIYRRDLTERGWPMDKQILASIRAGQGASIGITNKPTLGGGV